MILSLHLDILKSFNLYLSYKDLRSLAVTCKTLHRLYLPHIAPKNKFIRNYSILQEMLPKLVGDYYTMIEGKISYEFRAESRYIKWYMVYIDSVIISIHYFTLNHVAKVMSIRYDNKVIYVPAPNECNDKCNNIVKLVLQKLNAYLKIIPLLENIKCNYNYKYCSSLDFEEIAKKYSF